MAIQSSTENIVLIVTVVIGCWCVMGGASIEDASSVPSSVPSVGKAAPRVKCAVDTATRTASASSTARFPATSTCPTSQPGSRVSAGSVTVSV